MKERPILFSASMVRALLAGTKTQTRRVVKAMPVVASPSVSHIRCELHPFSRKAMAGTPGESAALPDQMAWVAYDWVENAIGIESIEWLRNPYGQPGDRLWVKETFFDVRPWRYEPLFGGVAGDFIYRAEYEYREEQGRPDILGGRHWRPSIFMPRAASRLTLEIASVRVERLQDITREDAIAEGLEARETEIGPFYPDYGWKLKGGSRHEFADPRESYRTLWEKLNGAGSWAANPWVWVLEFKRVEARS